MSDAENLPFAGESFDVTYSNGVLHHTPDTARSVRELHRVLRPGGLARVMLYHRGSLHYWLQIVFRYGVLSGGFFRGQTTSDLMSKHIEINEGGGRPLVKVYNQSEARELFSMFREVTVQVEQLTRPELYFLSPIVPETVFQRLCKSVGWNVIVSARK